LLKEYLNRKKLSYTISVSLSWAAAKASKNQDFSKIASVIPAEAGILLIKIHQAGQDTDQANRDSFL